jgi:curved DNA-binding protein CbpA
MSAPPAGKFQDHYIVLGVETNADSDAVLAAYDRLAEKYAGDEAKLASLTQAYEVLSDPDLRSSFDKVKGVDHEAGNPKFTGAEFFESLERSAGLRSAVLCLLYDRMRMKSFKPSLSMRHLEAMLQVKGEGLNFALFYLKKRGFVFNDDKSALAITVDGMDFLEQNRPSPEIVMEFIKPEAVINPPPKPIPPQPKVEEPVMPALNNLNKALQKKPAEAPPERVTLRFKP